MNYRRIYENIVRTQDLNSEEYTEVHHIIPKCMGGTNEPENLTRITARKHFLAHWLLCKIYPENVKLRYAFSRMRSNSKNMGRKLTSMEYSVAKRAATDAFILDNPMYKEEVRLKISKLKTGVVLSKEIKDKISKTKTGVKNQPHSDETKQKQKGEEYHCPITLKVIRFKVHIGQNPPNDWVRGRPPSEYIWITDGTLNLKIRKSSEIPFGFKRGRTSNRNKLGEFEKCQH